MAHSIESNKFGEEKHLEVEEDDIVLANNITSLIALPLAVQSAIELGIFEILAKAEKLSAKNIADEIGSKNPEAATMLDRLLRLLACHSMLNCSLSHEDFVTPQRLYSLAPISICFTTDPDGASIGPFLNLNMNNFLLKTWSGLKGAIMEGGIPFNRVNDMDIDEYVSLNTKFNDIFNKAMTQHTSIVMKRVLECYKGFENINTLVDVGGGHGIILKMITSKYCHMQGVNFDLPHVIEHAPNYPGVTHVGGDMFESVPKGDAIFMKGILHSWDDEHCLNLLKNCYEVISNNGKVIVLEYIISDVPENTIISKINSQVDMLMMTLVPGGKERTKNEYIELALGSGFSGIQFVRCISGFWVMEFFK